MNKTLFTFLLASTAFACAPTPSVESLVEDHAQETGLAYRDCGVIDHSYPFCNAALTAAEVCMQEAFASCTPARAFDDRYTIEGDPIPQYWFVEPGTGGSCRLVVFSDSSEDAFKGDYADIQESECSALEVVDDTECVAAYPAACVVVAEWN